MLVGTKQTGRERLDSYIYYLVKLRFVSKKILLPNNTFILRIHG